MTATSRHYATIWERIADHIPQSPALRHGQLMRSWAEFERRAACLAGALRAHGIADGDGVAAYLYNCPEYFEIFFGALKIRALPSNVNYRYRSDELLTLLENSEAKALFFDAALRDQVASIADRATGVRLLVDVGGASPSPVPGAYVRTTSCWRARSSPRGSHAATTTCSSRTPEVRPGSPRESS